MIGFLKRLKMAFSVMRCDRCDAHQCTACYYGSGAYHVE